MSDTTLYARLMDIVSALSHSGYWHERDSIADVAVAVRQLEEEAVHGRIANILSTVTDTPETDAFLTAKNCTRDNPVAFDWIVGFARSLERKTANAYKVYQACNDDLIKCDEEVMRWFKAASPYATPGSLEEGLKKLRADETCLCLSFPHACPVHRKP